MLYTKQLLASIVVGIFSVALAVISYPIPSPSNLGEYPIPSPKLGDEYHREFTAQNGNKVAMNFKMVGEGKLKLTNAFVQDEKTGMTRVLRPTEDSLFSFDDEEETFLDSYSKMEEVKPLAYKAHENVPVSQKELPEGVTQTLYRTPHQKDSFLFTQSRVKTNADGKEIGKEIKEKYLYREFVDAEGTPIKLRFEKVGNENVGNEKVKLNKVTLYNREDGVKFHYSPRDKNEFLIKDLHDRNLPENVLESFQNSNEVEENSKEGEDNSKEGEDRKIRKINSKHIKPLEFFDGKEVTKDFPENFVKDFRDALEKQQQIRKKERKAAADTTNEKSDQNSNPSESATSKSEVTGEAIVLPNVNDASKYAASVTVAPTNQQGANVDSSLAKQNAASDKALGDEKTPIATVGANVGSAAPAVQAVSPQPAQVAPVTPKAVLSPNNNAPDVGSAAPAAQAVSPQPAPVTPTAVASPNNKVQSKSKWGKDDVAAGAGVILGTVGLAIAAGSLGNTVSHSGG